MNGPGRREVRTETRNGHLKAAFRIGIAEAHGVMAVTGEEPPTCSGREEEHLGGGTTEQTALDARSRVEGKRRPIGRSASDSDEGAESGALARFLASSRNRDRA